MYAIKKSEFTDAGWELVLEDGSGHIITHVSHHSTEADAITQAEAAHDITIDPPEPHSLEDREAAAAEVQAWLDAHAVFSDKGITASADEVDSGAVHLTFPTDLSQPVFWAAAAKEIVQTHRGEYVTAPYTVRVRKGEPGATAGANAYAHLARIAEAFPS